MIDLSLFRHRVGIFNNTRKRRSEKVSAAGNCFPDIGQFDILKFFAFYIYLYFAVYSLFLILGMLLDCTFKSFPLSRFQSSSPEQFSNLSHSLVKLFSAILFTSIFTKDFRTYRSFGSSSGAISGLCFWNLHKKPQSINYLCWIGGSLVTLILGCVLWVFAVNSLLVVIVNPSLLNPGPQTTLTVTSFNAQGLIPFSQLACEHPSLDNTKLFELHHYLYSHKPDISMLNETWLKKSISSSEVIPSTYKTFRLDRTNKTHPPDPQNPRKFRKFGGGVLIAVRCDLDVVSTCIEYNCSAELLGITLKFGDGKKIILCSFYRVGTLGAKNHQEFQEYVRKARLRRGVSGVIVVGDFNLPLIDWENFSGPGHVEQSFLDTFSNFGLEQLVNFPTHTGGNILDLVVTDKPHLISDLEISCESMPCKSDHSTISFRIKSKIKRIKSSKRDAYNFKRANWDALNADLNDIDWVNELSGDIEHAWDNFKRILNQNVNKSVPKLRVGGKVEPPWFDAETHQACRKKDRLHSEYKKTEDPVRKAEKYLKFSKSRSDFKKLVASKLESSFDDEEDSNLITKKFWSYVKATSKSTRIPELVHLDDVHKTSPLDQANLFNSFFYQQFSTPSNYDIPIDITGDQFDSSMFSSSIIFNILRKTNPSKAMGPDKIHGQILKNCARTLSPALKILFNRSYTSGILPSEWKNALVVPVHKKGSKGDVKNYRPISLTCLIAKIMERIVRDHIMIKCDHLLDQRQHGFMPKKSCSTQMVDFCDSLSLSLNKNMRSDVIYFDFAKAFDSVNHDLILKKLKHYYKIDGLMLSFISNYLSGRQQSVVVNGSISTTLPVLSGVPQGSILGPSLFVLFINDISAGISEGTNIMLYADDTKIWREINNEMDFYYLQKDINSLLDWATRNMMNFHPSKCKVLSISKVKPPLVDILPCIQHFYTMRGVLLDFTESEKDLGIIMNSTLNFNEQAESLYAKANQKFGMLKRNCHFVKDIDKRRALYLTLVRSIFEHCPMVWRPSSNTVIAKLESLQKRALKWIRDDLSVSYSIEELYHVHCKQLNILPIKYRFDYRDMKFFHEIVYGYSCVSLPYYLTFYSGNSRLRSTHLDHLSLVSSVTSKCNGGLSKSFFYRAHLIWNKLPLNLREIVRPGMFKNELLKHIWKEHVTVDPDPESGFLTYNSLS